ncbi:hypothetical protein ECP029943810_5063 [Escherichia coli P0299438.10]|nr:hypothetical protein ECP03022932_3462 [Escherichia coli P0302293.2]EMX82365.1 hypothetical protein EC2726800_5398 [Escherichia coli 2726800]ENA11403.1 hypothetical protein EC2016001_5259 [Escherichia coli 201600.1]ENB83519.1 hypothetical protein ECP029943810_5063 [Escherichia coli P0299438.10]ENB94800.1 hypothetical protein ECP02994384_5217 [Escherichia coli P0299438.4]END06829.1 hypothetical protein ECP03023083_4915 [Escherichia coli P0302308.3]END28674.1 hypothetical protein ECP03023084_
MNHGNLIIFISRDLNHGSLAAANRGGQNMGFQSNHPE